MKLRPLLAQLDSVANFLQSPLLLAIRLYWGWRQVTYSRSGTPEQWKAKLMDIPTFTERFTNWGVPMPKLNVIMAGSTEAGCGLLLAAGLFARPAAIPLIGTMTVAYLTAHKDVLHGIFDDPDAFVSAAPFLFLLAAMIVLAFGPGKLSLDALLGKNQGPAK